MIRGDIQSTIFNSEDSAQFLRSTITMITMIILMATATSITAQEAPSWTKITKTATASDTITTAERIFAEEAGTVLGIAVPKILDVVGGIGGIANIIAKLMDSDDHDSISQIKAVDKKRKLFEKYRMRLERSKINETEYRYLIRSLMEIPTNK